MIKQLGNIQKAIEELKNDKNNAVSFVYENPETVEGPLSGSTITIKDLFTTKDAPTQASSKILKGFTPKYDATVVEKLRKSGAAIVGKVHMDELALGGTGTYSGFGVIKNPLDSSRLIGGSSSGSAATLTESITFSLGSDTGDSIRVPASFVGKVGFKPSYGAVSRYGMIPFASSLDTVGWMSHNVNDTIALSRVLFGQDEKDMTSKNVELPTFESKKPNKVGVLVDFNNILNPEIARQFTEFKNKLIKNNIEVVEIAIDPKLLEAIDITYAVISYSEASSNDANLNGIAFGQREDGDSWDEIMTNTRSKNFGFMVQRRFSLGAYFLASENQKEMFLRAQKVRRLIVNAFNEALSKVDVLAFPTVDIAPKSEVGKESSWFTDYLIAFNFGGQPTISIPFGQRDNMPFGLHLASKLYEDKSLLSYSLYIEELIGGKHD